jgi:hypothetical protein
MLIDDTTNCDISNNDHRLRGSNIHCSEINFSDNIGGINLEPYLAYGPIDAGKDANDHFPFPIMISTSSVLLGQWI